MARRYGRKMHGLGEIKDDAIKAASVGAGAVVGVAAARFLAGSAESAGFSKEADGSMNAYGKIASVGIPLVGSIVTLYLGKDVKNDHAKNAIVGASAGMAAVAIAKLVKILSPKLSDTFYLNGLAAGVDTYDSALLAGLGEMDYSVNRYMMAGSPTQIQSLMGSPTQIQSLMGAPLQVKQLAGAPLSATLM